MLIGVTAKGKMGLGALAGGFRESELFWKMLLGSLKKQGLINGPELAIGDGVLGFW